jgi:hypothetical protein
MKTPMIFDDFSFLEKLFIRLINLPQSAQKTCSILSIIKLILKETNFLFKLWLFLPTKLIKIFYSPKTIQPYIGSKTFRSFYSLLTLFNDAKQLEINCQSKSASLFFLSGKVFHPIYQFTSIFSKNLFSYFKNYVYSQRN